MAIDYGKRSGLIGSGLYYLDTGLTPTWNPDTGEYESNNVTNLPNPEAFQRSVKPYHPFKGQTRSPVVNGSTGAEESSAYEHLKASNDDATSNARYQELIQKREELKRKIAQLSADIAYQEKLRAIEMKNDPMWDIAKQQYIMKGDSSGLESIMSRMEAEKDRKNTENVAKMNKAAEDKSKQDAAMESYERKKEVYNYLKSKVAKLAADDPSRPEAVDNLKGAEIALKYAARRAGMEDEFTELSRVEEADLAEKTAKLSMFFRSAGVDSPESFKSLYESADDEQKRRMLNDAKLLGLSDKDLGITGEAAKDELKQEQKKKQDEKNAAAKKKKNDFKNANKNTTFEMNGLTGNPIEEQEWIDFQNKAKDSGWSGLKLKTNGTILWP